MADMSQVLVYTIEGNASALVGAAGAAEGALGRLEGATGRVGGAMLGLVEGAAKAAIAVGALTFTGVVAGLSASVVAATSFQKEMSAVGAVSGASASQMKQMSDLALKLGADTSFSASESAKGIEELAKAGVSVADIMGGAAKASLDLAAAGGVDVATAAEIASNAMNVFNIKGSDMAHVADEIAGAANASAIDVNDYKFSLAAAGAVAATVGINFDDLTTAIAVMGQAGIKGSDAGTSLKTMLLNLTPSTKAQIAEAKELGIVTADGANKFFDASGKAKSLSDIAGVLQNATKGLTEQQRLQALQTLFGTDAVRAAAIMAKAGATGFDEMAASIGKISATDVANTRLDNLAGSIEKFKGSAETAAITVGLHFLPPLRRLVDTATELLNRSLPALDQFGAAAGAMFDRLITRAGASGPALLSLGTAALDAAHHVVELAQSGGSVTDWLARLSGPLTTVTEIIRQGFVSAVTAVRDALPAVQSALSTLLPIVETLGRAFVDNLVTNIQFLTERVVPPLLSIIGQTASFFMTTLQPAITATSVVLRGILGDTLDWLASTAWPPLLVIAQETVGFWTTTLLPLLPGLAAGLRSVLGDALQWLATTGWPAVLRAATTAVNYFTGTVLPMLPALADRVRNVLGSALIWIADTGWPLMLSAGQAVVAWIMTTGIPAFQSIVSWLGEKIPPILTWITETGWPGLVSAGIAVASWIVDTALPALSSLVDWLGPKVSVAVSWLTETGWPTLVSAAGTVTDWITTTALPALSSLWDWLSVQLFNALGWLTDTGWPALASAGTAVSDWILDTALPALGAIWDWLSPKLSAALGWLTDTGWPAMKAAGLTVTDWVNDIALPALHDLWSVLNESLAPAVSWFIDTGWPDLKTAGDFVVDLFSRMYGFAKDLWNEVGNAGIWDDLSTAFRNLWDAGEILVETFWPGMKDAWADTNANGGAAKVIIEGLVVLLKGASTFILLVSEGFKTIASALKMISELPEPPAWVKIFLQGIPGGSLIGNLVGSGQRPSGGGGQRPSGGGGQRPSGGGGSAPAPPGGGQTPAPRPGSNLNAGPIDNSSRQSFVKTAWPYMLQAAGGNAATANMMLAAAISENGDVGKGGGFIGNNFFGIKGKGPAGSFTANTWEQTANGPVNIQDEFAAYNDPVQGFHGFFDFLEKNSRYAPALAAYRQSGDPNQLFQMVNRAGYATDPNWAGKVANISANQVAPITSGLSQSMSATQGATDPMSLPAIVTMLGQIGPAANGAKASVVGFQGSITDANAALNTSSQIISEEYMKFLTGAGQANVDLVRDQIPTINSLEQMGVISHSTADSLRGMVTDVIGAQTAVAQTTPVISDASSVLDALGNTIGVTAQTATDLTGAMATDVTGNMDAMAQGAADSALAMAADTSGAVQSMQSDVTTAAAGMSGDVLTSVTDLGDGVLTVVQDMHGNTLATITDMAGNVVSTTISMASDVTAAAAGLSAGVVPAAEAMSLGVVCTVQCMATGSGVAARQVGQEIAASIEADPQFALATAQGLGDSLVTGVSEGIDQGSGDLGDSLSQAIEEAIQQAKDENDIASPSGRTRRELGLPLALGAAHGIDDGRGHVQRAMGALIDMPDIGGSSSRRGGGSGGGDIDYDRLAVAIVGNLPPSVVVNGAGWDEIADQIARKQNAAAYLRGVRRGG